LFAVVYALRTDRGQRARRLPADVASGQPFVAFAVAPPV
jgi:hypothetical protein